MKSLVKFILKRLSKAVLKKYQPVVIGITGSIGKTSTKEAIALVLKDKRRVRASCKSYNDELGVPLTILGQKNVGSSILGWIKIFINGLRLIFKRNLDYPEMLILEMGVEKPGDMKHLASFVQPDVFVVTHIAQMPVHLEYFESKDDLVREKFYMVRNLYSSGLLVYNYDNEVVNKYGAKFRNKVKTLSFGFNKEAMVKASNILLTIDEQSKQIGINFKLNFKGVTVPLFVPRLLGKYQLYPILAAVAVGLHYDLNLVEMSQKLKAYRLPVGRMNLIKGKSKSLIIDDTYNSSPPAAIEALKALDNLYEFLSKSRSTRRIAVLGDMLELGHNEKKAHKLIVQKAVEDLADIVYLVGERMRAAGQSLLKESQIINGNILFFENASSCGEALVKDIRENDLILIKGSQGMRMEKITERVMADPQMKGKLLVRQDELWEKR